MKTLLSMFAKHEFEVAIHVVKDELYEKHYINNFRTVLLSVFKSWFVAGRDTPLLKN